MAGQRGVALGQELEQVLHGGRRVGEVADQHHPRHLRPVQALTPFSPRSLRALSTLGGDIGSSVKRMPVAFSMALAIAAIGGTMGVSPTPRTPYGWRGFGTSTMIASIIGTSEATGMR